MAVEALAGGGLPAGLVPITAGFFDALRAAMFRGLGLVGILVRFMFGLWVWFGSLRETLDGSEL